MEEKQETANWFLARLFFVLVLNAIVWAIGVAVGSAEETKTALRFLSWAMAVGVTCTWLVIVHVLLCRMKKESWVYLLLYAVPSLLIYTLVKIVDIPLPKM